MMLMMINLMVIVKDEEIEISLPSITFPLQIQFRVNQTLSPPCFFFFFFLSPPPFANTIISSSVFEFLSDLVKDSSTIRINATSPASWVRDQKLCVLRNPKSTWNCRNSVGK